MAEVKRLPGPLADHWDWQLQAACRGMDTAIFFHPDGERGPARAARQKRAAAICATCPVRTPCAAHALKVQEPYGTWGGIGEDEREIAIAQIRRRLA